MSISIQDFPFLPGSAGGTVVGQQGPFQVANVLADGTETAITFPTAFTTSCTGISPSIIGVPDYELTIYVVNGTITSTGFTVYIAGGKMGATVTLSYVAYGN